MATRYIDLPGAVFDGLGFPWQKYSIRGGLRDHVHEFPHTPGGSPEKMGRKLYEIEFSGLMMAGAVDPKWADLWPKRVDDFRKKFESELTADLTIPSVGTIKAYCFDWGQDGDAKIQNGATTTWKFREDSSDDFILSKLVQVGPASLGAQANALMTSADDRGVLELVAEAFDAIQSAVDDVLAVRDQALMYSNLAASKINYLTYLCAEADRTLDVFNDPSNWPVLEALKQLWASSKELAANFTDEAGTLRSYVTPTEMTISDVASAVYSGDRSRGMDILKLNAIDDALAIPAGQSIRYIAEAA